MKADTAASKFVATMGSFMNDRRFEAMARPLEAVGTRRQVLGSALVLGGVMLAGSRLEARAARRGYSGPAAGAAGVIVTILDGELPGELRIETERGVIGSYLETRNFSSFLVEVDVRLPGGKTDNTHLHPDETWWLQIDGSGTVRMTFRIAGDDHQVSVSFDV
ncbi:MAG TPA: hypothetical protein VFP05_11460 [Thermomicrobiales bacterium]|nr:hypothetical protein [Thermomicrobiales bacterium]